MNKNWYTFSIKIIIKIYFCIWGCNFTSFQYFSIKKPTCGCFKKNLPSGRLSLIGLSYYTICPWWCIVWVPSISHVLRFASRPRTLPLPILCLLRNNYLFQLHSHKHFWYSVQPDSDYVACKIQGIKSLAICFPKLLS